MRTLLAVACCALPVSAYAIAATPEQILCNSGQVVVADVISGKSADCRLQHLDCVPHDIGWLQIRIVDVLAVGGQRCAAGLRGGREMVSTIDQFRRLLGPIWSRSIVRTGSGCSEGREQSAESLLYYEVASLDDEARRRLFMLFEKGMNIPAEDINAIAWYRTAADKGDVRAQVGLGLHYKFHKGVEKNWSVAYALFNLAKLSSSKERRHIPDFSGPAVTAEIYMTPATWTLVHAMATPGNLLQAMDEFVAHPPSPVNRAIMD